VAGEERYLLQGPDLVGVLRRTLADPDIRLVKVLGDGNTVSQIVVEMPEERKTDLERELGDDFLIERDAPLDPL
jgi:hypothetical protein